MEKKKDLTVNNNGKPCYKIVFRDSFQFLLDELDEINGNDYSKIMIVTDTNVSGLYLQEIEDILIGGGYDVMHHIFQAGEESKNLNTVSSLYRDLVENHYDRRTLLIALGGGVVGDLTGYAAATYLRGVDFIQIPTTLLSQVDSSVGGKTGVDFDNYKNMIGAFYMPKLVYMNANTLHTLPEDQFLSGLGEVVKYGYICDGSFLEWLDSNHDQVFQRDIKSLNHIIRSCCAMKQRVVEEDPTEKGIRAYLNFGHTIGHAVEKLMNFQIHHGQCVSIGMAAALYLSMKKGYIKEEEYQRELAFIKGMNLPVFVEKPDFTAEDVLEATKSDKKRNGNRIKFVLIKPIGSALIDESLNDSDLLLGIQSIIKE